MSASGETHAQAENRVLFEMGRLATAQYEYSDVVASLLDLVEELVSSPFLQLTMDEGDHVGRYHRATDDSGDLWCAEMRAALTPLPSPSAPLPYTELHFPHLDSWAVSVGVVMRSGRWGELTVAASGPLDLSQHEVHLLSRLAHQAVLVLDHALLSTRADEMRWEDTLTGALSHARLLELLEVEIARHRFFGRPLAMVMVDVDGLNAINRSYGRRYGNHVLQKLATILQASVRPVDIVARCGLDEFAVVLLEMDAEAAEPFAQSLTERLMGVEFAGGEVRMTVARAHMRHDETLAAEEFLRRGERALYASKRQVRALAGMLRTGRG
jgi:diguanylate cyclase (GGDEF)-like protein